MRSMHPLSLALAMLAPMAAASAQRAMPAALAVGDHAIDGARLAPRGVIRKLVVRQNGAEQQFGTIADTLTATTVGGAPVFLRVQHIQTPRGLQLDTAIVRRADLRPIYHSGHGPGGILELHFAGAKVTGRHVSRDSTTQAIDQTLAAATFDSNVSDLLVAALPLAAGYGAKLPVYIYESGGLVWMSVHVSGTKPMTGPRGAEEAWVVDAELGGRAKTFLIGRTSREVLGYTAATRPGVEMRMSL